MTKPVAAKVCAALMVLCLSGCANDPAPPVNPLAGGSAGYETGATVTCAEFEASVNVSSRSPDLATVTFTAPETLRDMTFSFRDGAVDVSYRGLSFGFHPAAFPGDAVAEVLVAAVDKAVLDEGIQVAETEEGLCLTGVLDSGPFTLCLDPDSAVPKKLLLPAGEMEIEFHSFRFFP